MDKRILCEKNLEKSMSLSNIQWNCCQICFFNFIWKERSIVLKSRKLLKALFKLTIRILENYVFGK